MGYGADNNHSVLVIKKMSFLVFGHRSTIHLILQSGNKTNQYSITLSFGLFVCLLLLFFLLSLFRKTFDNTLFQL